MTIDTLRYVYAAYLYGSYREAADALSVTYSVVAKQVLHAEEELGVRLFERASKSREMKLTAAGTSLMEEIGATLNAYDHLAATAKSFAGKRQRVLQLRRGFFCICEEEMDIMARFAWEQPGVVLSQKFSSSEDMMNQMVLGRTDGIFRAYLGDDGTKLEQEFPAAAYDRILISRSCQFHFLMGQNNPLAGRAALSLADRDDILRQTFLITGTAEGRQRSIPRQMREYLGIRSEPIHTRMMDGSNITFLPQLLNQGDYLYPVARRLTRPPQDMAAVPVRDWTDHVELYFISARSNDNPTLALFRACVEEYAGRQ